MTEPVESNNGTGHVWYEKCEYHLAHVVYGYKSLWYVRDESDFGPLEMGEIATVRASVNKTTNSLFSDEQVIKKWLELSNLFDVKYAMNGFTMEPRTNVYHRDGTLKDDLSESWKLFHILSYMKDSVRDEERKKRAIENREKHLSSTSH